MKNEILRTFAAGVMASSIVAAARADDAPPAVPPPPAAAPAAAPGDAAADPPARVGRLSYLTGKVMLHPPGDGDWTEAARNYPVTTGETFWADDGAFIEVQVAGAEIRVGGSTELGVVTLDDNRIALGIPEGSVNIVVDKLPDGAVVEANMPSGVVQIFSVGRYHVDAGTTSTPPRALAFKGLARLVVSGSTLDVKDGEAGVVNGVNPAVLVTQTAEPDDLDKWADQRQDDLAAAAQPKPRPEPKPAPARDVNPPPAQGNPADSGAPTDLARPADVSTPPQMQTSPAYVSDQIPGGAELAQSGEWTTSPDYGQVWYPSGVAVDWAPYRYGHWAFVPPWGWTWIDDAPWGFAPFHYGRWAVIDGRWGWVPGEIAVQPVYAPALVSFVGIGAVAAIGVDAAIGWYPLGPREVYVPSYHVSEVYVTHLNGGGYYHDVDRHMNGHFLTSVRDADFAGAHPVQHAVLQLPPSVVEKGGGPLIREPGLRPHLDPAAIARPPEHVTGRPLAGTALGRPPGSPQGPTHANFTLPPPPKDAIHGRQEGPVRTGAGAGIAPLHPKGPIESGAGAGLKPPASQGPIRTETGAGIKSPPTHESPIHAGATPRHAPPTPGHDLTTERHVPTTPNGPRSGNAVVREPQVRPPVPNGPHPQSAASGPGRPPPVMDHQATPVVNRPPPPMQHPIAPVVNHPAPPVNYTPQPQAKAPAPAKPPPKKDHDQNQK
jgi:hypothetical protein